MKRILSFFIAIVIAINVSICSFFSVPVSAATSFSGKGVALPLATFVTLMMAGTGIIAKNATDDAKTLISDVSSYISQEAAKKKSTWNNWVRSKSVLDGSEYWGKADSSNYNNNYVQGSSDDNNNVWFPVALVAATADALNHYKAYTQSYNEKNKFLNISGAYSYSQLINACPSSVREQAQLIVDYISNLDDTNEIKKGFEHSQIFSLQYNATDFVAGKYPRVILQFYYVADLTNVAEQFYFNNYDLVYKTYTNSSTGLTVSGDCLTQGHFLSLSLATDYNVIYKAKTGVVFCNSRNAGDDFSIYLTQVDKNSSTDLYAYRFQSDFIFRKGWDQEIVYNSPYDYTDAVYNPNEGITTQYPDWSGIADAISTGIAEGISNIALPSIKVSIPSLDIDTLLENSASGGTATQPIIQQGDVVEGDTITNITNIYNSVQTDPSGEKDPSDDPVVDSDALTQPQLDESIKPLIDSVPAEDTNPLPDADTLPETVKGVFDDAVKKIEGYTGNLWDKIPFCVPYDLYLLMSSLFSSGGGSGSSPVNPSGVSVSFNNLSHDMTTGSGVSWKTAPVIHIKLDNYPVGGGVTTNIDYNLDLSPLSYIAMCIYWGIAVLVTIFTLKAVLQSFKESL